MSVIRISVPGPIPSKKNSTTRKTLTLPGGRKVVKQVASDEHAAWAAKAGLVVSAEARKAGLTRPLEEGEIALVEFRWYAQDRRVQDLSNKWESVADLFNVRGGIGIWRDDNCLVLGEIHLKFCGVVPSSFAEVWVHLKGDNDNG